MGGNHTRKAVICCSIVPNDAGLRGILVRSNSRRGHEAVRNGPLTIAFGTKALNSWPRAARIIFWLIMRTAGAIWIGSRPANVVPKTRASESMLGERAQSVTASLTMVYDICMDRNVANGA